MPKYNLDDNDNVVLERDNKTINKNKKKPKYPQNMRIIMFNDDVTDMKYVSMILVECFEKSPIEAQKIMLMTHLKPTPDTEGTIISTVSVQKASEMMEKFEIVKKMLDVPLLVITKEVPNN